MDIAFDLKKIGLWVVIWLVGYGLGLLEAKIKNDLKENKKKDMPEAVPLPLPMPAAIPENEILSVFERVSGVLNMRLDGEMIERKSDLNAEKRARLLKIVVALRPWLEKPTEEKSDEVLSAAPLAQKRVSPPPAPLVEPENNPVMDIEQKAESFTTSKLSMVEQIDRILQKKLAGHPLEKEKIYLRTALNGTLLIRIGAREYEWIDDIPEQPIQAIIREAIAEWEKSAI